MAEVANGDIRHRPGSVVNDITMDDHYSEEALFLSLNNHVKKIDGLGEKVRLLTWDGLEPWQQDNHFLIRAYRPATASYVKSIASLKYLHNQSINIWSHLLGTVAFMTAAFVLYQVFAPRYSTANWTDLFVFGCFFLGAVVCLLLSTCFHTFGNHSEEILHHGLLMDLVGIIFLITGSFVPGVYYGFYCEPGPTYTYWSMVSGASFGRLA